VKFEDVRKPFSSGGARARRHTLPSSAPSALVWVSSVPRFLALVDRQIRV